MTERPPLELTFERLNLDWEAEPSVPIVEIAVSGATVVVSFLMNPWLDRRFPDWSRGRLTFEGCSRYRLGSPNDEGWFIFGQDRYERRAPDWGQFYELKGPDPLRTAPTDWIHVTEGADAARHFLFYFKDHTFECLAQDWAFSPPDPNEVIPRAEDLIRRLDVRDSEARRDGMQNFFYRLGRTVRTVALQLKRSPPC